jgi:hypothetical protein
MFSNQRALKQDDLSQLLFSFPLKCDTAKEQGSVRLEFISAPILLTYAK